MAKTHKKAVGALLHHKGAATFRVWAPFAQGVAVTGVFNNWAKLPLASEGDGYWSVEADKAEPGQEYKYVITTQQGGELYKNDPRSLQVTTAAGNSVLVDDTFDWDTDTFTPPPVAQQVMYELHIGTFNRPDPSAVGTFADAKEKLDYLASLGINMIELMPITSMSMDRGWGYATQFIYALESLYGGRQEFMEFVKTAHSKGIGVIVDVVYNHIGPDTKDMWQFDGWNENNGGGIYFYNDWRAETPWGATRPDYGRPEVRQYLLDNATMWLHDCHVDGLRLDSTIFLRNVKGRNDDPEHDLEAGWGLMQQITSVAKKINSAAIVIAEDVGCNPYLTKPKTEGGAGFSAQWEVCLPYTLRNVLKAVDDRDRNLTGLCNELIRCYNGDAFQRVIYSDSHDSAANGAARLNQEISPTDPGNIFARRRSLIATAIVLTAPGIPMLFQGQEFMEDGSFNDWQGLDWDKATRFAGILEAHKHLIALRKNQYNNSRGLSGQSVAILHLNEEAKMLAYHRWDQGGTGDDVIVIINFANHAQKDYWINFPRPGAWHVRFNSDWKGYSRDFKNTGADSIQVDGDRGMFTIGPYAVLILSQDK
ncbi:MAG TPA: alpha-amylase family glycosyl hydrolase [Candidatus Saccharimonadales bacterium]|nr:alpha-amylase family glycosyl hydrolase [Candidatus Saccharimonadales bacterium]